MSAGTSIHARQPVDSATEPYLRGIYTPQLREVDEFDLVIEGELPDAMEGDYLRNGANPRFNPLGGYVFPLDGDGMLHRVEFRNGRARYTNRFVRTPALVAEEAAGRALWPGITGFGYTPGPELVGPELAHTVKDLPAVNVIRHAGRLLALSESGPPFSLSPELATLHRETFCGMLPAGITAHPKIDPATGEMVAFCYGLQEPFLTWSVIGPDGLPTRAQTPVGGMSRPAMIHDMALTQRYVVLVVSPLFFDVTAGMSTGSPLSWEPEEGTRIALLPRDGGPITWFSAEAFWLGHTANAYDSVDAGDGRPRVVLDYVEWPAPGGLVSGAASGGALARLTLDAATGQIGRELLVDRAMEFPRIDDRRLTTPHRQIATALESGRHHSLPGGADQLGWYDTASGRFEIWDAGNFAVGEQTFVPNPGDPEPLSGWWITFATDRTDLTSRLLVLPAADPTGGPIASVRLPQRVPPGLHGTWLPRTKD